MEEALRTLNPPQRAATTHVNGPLLVLAGAGSGKTRVITHRIAYLLHIGVPASNILAVSFTNKAAGEMRERVAHMVGKKVASKVQLSTFHSMGADILRRYIDRLGYHKPFSILDPGDQVAVVKDVMAELRIHPGIKPKDVHALISRAKNAFCEPIGLKSRFNPLIPYAQRVYPRYVQACKSLNGVDFDDLITLPAKILQDFPDVRDKVRQRYQYVMVDEYQDTNDTQLLLLRLICEPRNNLCVVGDDDQSIYAFRGAQARNILDFDKQFKGARVIKLEQNYRSTSAILQAANGLIANNVERRAKSLWSNLGKGDPIRYYQLHDADEEAEFVTASIERKHREEQVNWSDMAVLFRASNLLRTLEETLRDWNIPYRVIGSSTFFDRREVKDIVSYMQAILNPNNEIAVRRIINTPRRGLGPAAMESISNFAEKHKISMYTALGRASEIEGLGPQQLRSVMTLSDILHEYQERFAAEPIHVVLDDLLKILDFREWTRKQEKSPKVAAIRLQNIEELMTSVENFQRRQGAEAGNNLEKYVSRLMLDTSSSDDKEENTNAVSLMTLHASKGLEFPDVYLVGFEEEILPHSRSVAPGQDGDIAEERRLAYVGITRAKRRLVLTSALRRGRGQATRKKSPSRFLKEIPEKWIEINMLGEAPKKKPSKETKRANLARLRAVIFDD